MSFLPHLAITTLASSLAIAAAAWSPNAAACGTTPFVGEICIFAGNFAPVGYALADGQLLPINQNTALFSVLGVMYGGDGYSSFALPNTQGRFLLGAGTGPGLTPHAVGEAGGSEAVSLTVEQLPSHSHTAQTTVTVSAATYGQSAQGDQEGPAGNSWASSRRTHIYSSKAPNVAMLPGSIQTSATATTTLGNTGNAQPIGIMPPYLGVTYLIATQGIFPSRQ